MMVLCVVSATKSRMALRSRPCFATAAVRISSPAQQAPLAQRSGSLPPNFLVCASKYALAPGLVLLFHDPMPSTPSAPAGVMTFL
ncbi:MAG: hypothetical protein BWX79_02499 [Alphaproteobacteria bacterium ADurb.Bin100]|nr:MAG: hypothetical protein BWX79_02499 [Alphaproteobacteria bacterium ADurb.Bin100]